MSGAYDWHNDPGLSWLRQDAYGVTIPQVDAAEAWMPPTAAQEASAEARAAERDEAVTPGGEFFGPWDQGCADPDVAQAVADAGRDEVTIHNDMLLLEAVQLWDPMATLDAIGPNVEDAARLLAVVRATIKTLREHDDALSAFIASVAPGANPYPVEGVGALKVHTGSQRKDWDHAGIRSVCAASIANDMGIIPGPVNDVIAAWTEITGPPSRYRTTALKPILAAVDRTLDEFVTTTWGAKTVEIQ